MPQKKSRRIESDSDSDCSPTSTTNRKAPKRHFEKPEEPAGVMKGDRLRKTSQKRAAFGDFTY
jgi:hypothetical protein